VWKDSLRVETYDTVDELNATVGVVRVMNAEMSVVHVQVEELEEQLRWIQTKLFDIGSIFATVSSQMFKNMLQVTGADVTRMEKSIDHCQKDHDPLKEFILPGGERFRAFCIRRGWSAAWRSGCAWLSREKCRRCGEYHVRESSE
jgi:cob(I)alamin adenosyltransferase